MTIDKHLKLTLKSMFFLSKRQNRLFDYVLDRKDRFLHYKNVLFTWLKNLHFPENVAAIMVPCTKKKKEECQIFQEIQTI